MSTQKPKHGIPEMSPTIPRVAMYTVSTSLKTDVHADFMRTCERMGTTPYAVLRNAVKAFIANPYGAGGN